MISYSPLLVEEIFDSSVSAHYHSMDQSTHVHLRIKAQTGYKFTQPFIRAFLWKCDFSLGLILLGTSPR